MNYSSQLLEKAVTEINRLPGIGSKTALRLALHLLRQDEGKVDALANSIVKMRREVRYCNTCYNICDGECCEICSNPLRDKSIVCVVENIQDVMAIENTMQYRGLYHVLGGVISPMDGIGPSDLQIESLVERVRQGGVAEVILALSPTMEGDTTNYYIFRKLEETGVKVTVIARGVAQNDELQYTDEVTLGRALAGRIPFNNSEFRYYKTDRLKIESMNNEQYLLTLLCSASTLLASFFAIRFRNINAFWRIASLAIPLAFILLLYFYMGDSTQLYGIGILAIAFLFTLRDVKRQ